MTLTLEEFLKQDHEKLEEIANKYPKQVPPAVVAEYCGASPENIRASIEGGSLGFHWRKAGRLTSGNCIPTAQFVRFMLTAQFVRLMLNVDP